MENNENRELKASAVAKREKKKERREAKAARKEANKVEEKKTRPNNVILAVLIFGVLIGMFAFVKGYGYFSKPVDIAKYIEENGGADTYSGMMIDMYTTADITAEGNSMNIAMSSTTEDEAVVEELKSFYGGDDGKEQLEYIGAYFLTMIKPQVRGFSGDVTVTYKLNDEELNSVKLTYKEAKDVMEEDEEEAEEAESDAANADADAAEAEADAGAATEDAAAEDAAATEDAATEDATATEDAATEDTTAETDGE